MQKKCIEGDRRMALEVLKNDRLEEFVDYCRRHRREVDDSFLYEEDLQEFEPSAENPTYIFSNHKGRIIAAASLILDDYNRRGKKSRIRIFHSEVNDVSIYEKLLQALLQHSEGLEKIFLFVPKANRILSEYIVKLNFQAERYAYILLRENQEVPKSILPKGYWIRAFRPGIDERIWCEVRNAGFAKLQGSETPITPEMVTKWVSGEGYMEGGMMILFHKDKAIGVIMCEKDEYQDGPALLIGALAIIPEYQGKGLGRILLRVALQFAKVNSYNRTILSVNAENERAISLYLQEGFEEAEAYTCYKYELR